MVFLAKVPKAYKGRNATILGRVKPGDTQQKVNLTNQGKMTSPSVPKSLNCPRTRTGVPNDDVAVATETWATSLCTWSSRAAGLGDHKAPSNSYCWVISSQNITKHHKTSQNNNTLQCIQMTMTRCILSKRKTLKHCVNSRLVVSENQLYHHVNG